MCECITCISRDLLPYFRLNSFAMVPLLKCYFKITVLGLTHYATDIQYYL